MLHFDRGYLALLAGAALFLAVGIACIATGNGAIAIIGVTLVVLGFGALGALLRLNSDSK